MTTTPIKNLIATSSSSSSAAGASDNPTIPLISLKPPSPPQKPNPVPKNQLCIAAFMLKEIHLQKLVERQGTEKVLWANRIRMCGEHLDALRDELKEQQMMDDGFVKNQLFFQDKVESEEVELKTMGNCSKKVERQQRDLASTQSNILTAKEEFIKWTKASLSNNLIPGIDIDTFITGLISLGNDAEMIADGIYGHSKLNGDDFAAEFLRRRQLAYGSSAEVDSDNDEGSEDEEETLEEKIEWLWKSVKDFYSYLRFQARWIENNWPNITNPNAGVAPENEGRGSVVLEPASVADREDDGWTLVTRRTRNR